MADADRVRGSKVESMRAFYWRVLRRTPVQLWTAGDRVVTAGGLFLAALAGFSQEWLTAVKASAGGIAPSWGFLPVGLIFLYGLLRANYEEVVSERTRTIAAERQLETYTGHDVEAARREHGRQQGILRAIHAEMVSGRGPVIRLTASMTAGIAPLPKKMVENRLQAMGEPWRRDSYSLHEPEPSCGLVGGGGQP